MASRLTACAAQPVGEVWKSIGVGVCVKAATHPSLMSGLPQPLVTSGALSRRVAGEVSDMSV